MGYIEDHVNDVSVRKWNLVEFLFTVPLRLATCDFDVYALSHAWLGRSSGLGHPCKVTSIAMQGGVLSSGTIQIADGDNVVFALLRGQGGGGGVLVNVHEAWFDLANESPIPDATRLRAAGKIDTTLKDTRSGNNLVEIRLVGVGRGATAQVPTRLVSSLRRA